MQHLHVDFLFSMCTFLFAYLAKALTYSSKQFIALATGVNVINNSQLLLTVVVSKAAVVTAYKFSIKHMVFHASFYSYNYNLQLKSV